MFFRNSQRRPRRGIVAPMVALFMTGLIGITAIAIDGGVLQDNKRRVQAAADAAALAGGSAVYQHYPSIISTNTADPSNAARDAARAVAANNGYPYNGANSTVAVNIPPATGPFKDKIGYIEVVITYNQPRYFSGIWGS